MHCMHMCMQTLSVYVNVLYAVTYVCVCRWPLSLSVYICGHCLMNVYCERSIHSHKCWCTHLHM